MALLVFSLCNSVVLGAIYLLCTSVFVLIGWCYGLSRYIFTHVYTIYKTRNPPSNSYLSPPLLSPLHLPPTPPPSNTPYLPPTHIPSPSNAPYLRAVGVIVGISFSLMVMLLVGTLFLFHLFLCYKVIKIHHTILTILPDQLPHMFSYT